MAVGKKIIKGDAILYNGKTSKTITKEDILNHAKETGFEALKLLKELRTPKLPTDAEVKKYRDKLIKTKIKDSAERKYTDDEVEQMVEEYKQTPKKPSIKTVHNLYCIEMFPQHLKSTTGVDDSIYEDELEKALAEAEAKEAKSKK